MSPQQLEIRLPCSSLQPPPRITEAIYFLIVWLDTTYRAHGGKGLQMSEVIEENMLRTEVLTKNNSEHFILFRLPQRLCEGSVAAFEHLHEKVESEAFKKDVLATIERILTRA